MARVCRAAHDAAHAQQLCDVLASRAHRTGAYVCCALFCIPSGFDYFVENFSRSSLESACMF
jgi:hypothetical protein